MEYKLQTIDEFIEYYEQGYRVDREDLIGIYKISQKTFYRKIDYKDTPVTKVKISAELRRMIRKSFKEDERLTAKHIEVAEKKALFDEHEVFLHLANTGNFEIYVNKIMGGSSEYERLDDTQRENTELWLANYKAIKMYLWQSYKRQFMNGSRLLGEYYDLGDETERTRYKRALKRVPHLKFVVCGVSSYVFLEHGYYYDGVLKSQMHQKFITDFKSHQLQFELFSQKAHEDIENELNEHNQKVNERIRKYLSTASQYKRNKFFKDNEHLGEEFLSQFNDLR